MERIWLNNYPAGVPADIDPDGIPSLGALLQTAVSRFASRRAFISGATGKSVSYQELDDLSRALAAYFQQIAGLKPGARIALMMPNLLQYPVGLFACLRAGYTVVNVNPQYTARELEHQLRDSGAEAIVVLANMAHVLEKVLANTAVKTVIVTGAADLLPPPGRWIANLLIRLKKMVPAYSLPHSVSFLDALGQGAKKQFSPVPVKAGDIAFLQYTGGTTGVSKGAMLTHRNIIANVLQTKAWGDPFLDHSQEMISILPIPIYHVYALGAAIGFLHRGGTNVLIADPRNIPAFIKVLSQYRFMAMPAVNTLFNGLVHDPALARVDFSALRWAIGGGASVQQAVSDRWKAFTGMPIIEGYGLTECSPTVTTNPLNLREFNGSIGLPVPSTEISIRDDNGKEQLPGSPGELCVKGPQVMAGYWQRPEETRNVMTDDGFLRTGDIATIDEQGFIRIVDRKKDMILVSGFNVYPNEIEAVLAMHPEVMESAAIGIADEKTGEAPKVFVVRKSPSLTEAELISYCRENLAAYKVPRSVEFRTELPKSPVGKILRRELRQLA